MITLMMRFLTTFLLTASLALASNTVLAAPSVEIVALFKDKAMLQIDGQQKLLTTNDEGFHGVTLVSSNSNEAIIQIDGQQQTLRLSGQIGSTFTPPPPGKVVHILPNRYGMYVVNGRINGQSIRFLVDTGASHISLNGNQAKRLGIPYKLIGEVGASSTASGIAKVYAVNLKKVRIGDIELRNINALVHDGSFPTDALLGMSFLSQIKIQRDGPIMELRTRY